MVNFHIDDMQHLSYDPPTPLAQPKLCLAFSPAGSPSLSHLPSITCARMKRRSHSARESRTPPKPLLSLPCPYWGPFLLAWRCVPATTSGLKGPTNGGSRYVLVPSTQHRHASESFRQHPHSCWPRSLLIGRHPVVGHGCCRLVSTHSHVGHGRC